VGLVDANATAQDAPGTTSGRSARVGYPLKGEAREVTTKTNRRGCGNDAPMEITTRFPQPLGNLAETARFPHFHKPIPLVFQEKT